MIHTTITMDDNLMTQLMRNNGESSPAKALRQTVPDGITQTRIKKLLALRGQVALDDNWQELRDMKVGPLIMKNLMSLRA